MHRLSHTWQGLVYLFISCDWCNNAHQSPIDTHYQLHFAYNLPIQSSRVDINRIGSETRSFDVDRPCMIDVAHFQTISIDGSRHAIQFNANNYMLCYAMLYLYWNQKLNCNHEQKTEDIYTRRSICMYRSIYRTDRIRAILKRSIDWSIQAKKITPLQEQSKTRLAPGVSFIALYNCNYVW